MGFVTVSGAKSLFSTFFFIVYSFPATLPQACSIAWGSYGQSAGPGTWFVELHPILVSEDSIDLFIYLFLQSLRVFVRKDP